MKQIKPGREQEVRMNETEELGGMRDRLHSPWQSAVFYSSGQEKAVYATLQAPLGLVSPTSRREGMLAYMRAACNHYVAGIFFFF